MKRFLNRLCLFTLPVLVLISFAEFLLRKIPNDYTLKMNAYAAHAGDIETLVLGSSHAYYGLDPVFFNTKTFNGAHVGQTLDLDAAIFHKWEPRLTKLKFVILSVSDMSFFFKLANSPESWRMKNYSIYYKLFTTYRISDYFEVLNLPFSINRNRLISWYVKNESAITTSSLGYGTNYTSHNKQDLDSTAITALRAHKAKDSEYFMDEKNALEQIISTCNRRHVKVILFTPPAYTTFYSHIDPLQIKTAINTAEAFTKRYNNVFYLDFLKDDSFTANDYYDADHLNEIGAKKLSLKLNTFIDQPDVHNF